MAGLGLVGGIGLGAFVLLTKNKSLNFETRTLGALDKNL